MKAYFEIEWDDRLGKHWMSEGMLVSFVRTQNHTKAEGVLVTEIKQTEDKSLVDKTRAGFDLV